MYSYKAHGQALQASPENNKYHQTVLVRYGTMICQFSRWGAPEQQFGEWVNEYPPQEFAKSRPYKTDKVDQKTVRKYMGEAMWAHFAKYNIARISGHFNYSKDARFDHKTFSGQAYGTWLMAAAPRTPIAPPRRSIVPPVGGG
jgi:hypothetical protein